MLPGWIAGHYAPEELTIELAPLAQAAGARLISAQVQKLDLANRIAFTDGGEAFDFDVLSIATGAVVDVDAISGAREHALPLRPFERFITRLGTHRAKRGEARTTVSLDGDWRRSRRRRDRTGCGLSRHARCLRRCAFSC